MRFRMRLRHLNLIQDGAIRQIEFDDNPFRCVSYPEPICHANGAVSSVVRQLQRVLDSPVGNPHLVYLPILEGLHPEVPLVVVVVFYAVCAAAIRHRIPREGFASRWMNLENLACTGLCVRISDGPPAFAWAIRG